MNSAIENAILTIWENYGEPLTLSDMAKSAILSRFHFSRVFRAATGVSPGRFLSAVRMYQAKRLLISTSLTVTEISITVGYNSLGSFTNHFTESVGTSPSRFRKLWREGICSSLPEPAPHPSLAHGSVAGTLTLPPGYRRARVYVGAFQTPIIQRRPSSSAILEATPGQPARYLLSNVPPGDWFIRAITEADSTDPEPWTRRSLLVNGLSPVTVRAGALSGSDLALRPRRLTDLPVLFAIPSLEPSGLHRPPAAGSQHARPGRAFLRGGRTAGGRAGGGRDIVARGAPAGFLPPVSAKAAGR